MKRMQRVILTSLLGALLGLLGPLGCSRFHTSAPPEPAPLRVGVAPDYAPLAFKQGGVIVGFEADMAARLAAALGRPLRLVERRFDELIPSLLANEIDIIMTGMSITRARSLRIAFSDPYLKNGLMALMRVRDADRFPSAEAIKESSVRIGVKRGTVGDAFVQKECPKAQRIALDNAEHGADELMLRGIDLFIHDGHAIAWLVSEHETELTALWEFLDEDLLAWGLRRDDEGLRAEVNRLLSEWKASGELDRALQRWIPYADRFGRP